MGNLAICGASFCFRNAFSTSVAFVINSIKIHQINLSQQDFICGLGEITEDQETPYLLLEYKNMRNVAYSQMFE